MPTQPVQIIGLAWYRQADYERLKSIFIDGDSLPASFEQWEQKAEKLRQSRLAAGDIVVKAYIDPDTIADWCRAHGKDVDASGRMHFASTVAADYGRKLQSDRHG